MYFNDKIHLKSFFCRISWFFLQIFLFFFNKEKSLIF